MKIILERIKLYGYHGCHKEERITGGNYEIDVLLETDLTKPAASDQLSDTIDYCHIYEIVKKQMAIPSNLIEHVAKRIADNIIAECKEIEELEVKVSKLLPPVNGDVERVSVIWYAKGLGSFPY